MDIKNASVLVTGGAGGFGTATVRKFAQLGARVVIADVADERGQALAKEVGNGAVFVHTDIMSEDSIAAAVAKAVEIGPLRAAIIVHAGPPGPPGYGRIIGKDGSRAVPQDAFDHVVKVFLNSAYTATAHAAEAMAKNEPLTSGQRGVIVNTASIAGFEGQPGQVSYSAAKGGVIGMVLTLARDLAPIGIRSMAIAPGTFFTPAYRMTEEEAHSKWGQIVPNPKRMGHVDEYASLAAQIVENDFLNGTTIRIDGAQRF